MSIRNQVAKPEWNTLYFENKHSFLGEEIENLQNHRSNFSQRTHADRTAEEPGRWGLENGSDRLDV
jgi:hypothetical protein